MSNEPKCERCKDPEEALRREEKSLMGPGWFAHYVFDSPGSPTGIDYHTHGFPEKFGCPDIQIVLPVKTERLHGITHCVADLLKTGVKIAAGENFREILGGGFEVTFAEATEGDRTVLRMIIPDASGKLNQDELVEDFWLQWQGCNV